MWRYMLCPHILKLAGAFFHDDVLAIVTPWMSRGNIAEYLEKHPNADRLQLVSLSVPSVPEVAHFTSCRYLAFRCGQRNRIPPRTQHSAWGCQRGKPFDSCRRFDCGLVAFTDKHPHFGLHSTQSHARRLMFRPHRSHLCGNV